VMEFCGLPPIGQKRPMDGAQFHYPWVGEAGGGSDTRRSERAFETRSSSWT
jgi:hypothetical protein